ncbi:hypothetical protein LTS10_004887 [Elasticomyces elasticus]|nr:hypothetical protein LTS10_004887 [Elasticomyces elasticus]
MTSRNKRSMEDDISEQTSKRTKLQYTDVFTVLVGVEEEKFVLHASIATKHSKFFQAACNGGFKEAQEKVIHLPEVQPATFRAYVQWIYSGAVVVTDFEEHKTDVKGRSCRESLVKLYILADIIAHTLLRNKTIDEYVASCRSTEYGTNPALIKVAYKQCPAGSMLRKLFVDENVYFSTDRVAWLQEERDQFPVEFLRDLVVAMAGKTDALGDPWETSCEYHEHGDEFPSCKNTAQKANKPKKTM